VARDEKTPQEARFWAEFHRALDAAGKPSLAKISRDATEKLDRDLPVTTLREWVKKERLPRNSDMLLLMMQVINARNQCDWEELRDRAQIARDNQARAVTSPDRTKTPPADVGEHPPWGQPDPTPPAKNGGTPPRRVIWRWAAAGAAVVVVVATVAIVLIASDDPGSLRAAGTATPTEESRGNVPCRRPDGADREPPAPATPPTAYAKGGTGRVELIQRRSELVVFDNLADGCAIIVTAKADGATIGPWASTLGKTGRVKKGRPPTPPKHIITAWPEGTRTVEFRVCFGEVIDSEIIFEETDCGAWVSTRLD
jgi:hypothetical protein